MEELFCKFTRVLILSAGLCLTTTVCLAQSYDKDYTEAEYKHSYISQDNVSDKNVGRLVKYVGYQTVINKVGPPVEKIEKAVKQEDVWVYESFAAVFKKGLLVDLRFKPTSDLSNRVALDLSFNKPIPKAQVAQGVKKVNPDIQGLLKDFGLADGTGTSSSSEN